MNVFRAVPPVTPIMMAGMLVLARPEGKSVVSTVGSQKITPTAPAFWALVTLSRNLQLLRSMSANLPLREPAGRAAQPNGSVEMAPTSRNGAVTAPERKG